jgi:hypothetical protein
MKSIDFGPHLRHVISLPISNDIWMQCNR